MSIRIHYGCETLSQAEGRKDLYRSADGKVEVALKLDRAENVSEATLIVKGEKGSEDKRTTFLTPEGRVLREIYIPVPFKPPALFDVDARTAYERCARPSPEPAGPSPAPPAPPAARAAPAAEPPPAGRSSRALPPEGAAAPAPVAVPVADKPRKMSDAEVKAAIHRQISDYPPFINDELQKVFQRQNVKEQIFKILKRAEDTLPITAERITTVVSAYRKANPPPSAPAAPAAPAPSTPAAAPAAPPKVPDATTTDKPRKMSDAEIKAVIRPQVADYPALQRQAVVDQIVKIAKRYGDLLTEEKIRKAVETYRGGHPPVAAPVPEAAAAAPAAPVADKPRKMSDANVRAVIRLLVTDYPALQRQAVVDHIFKIAKRYGTTITEEIIKKAFVTYRSAHPPVVETPTGRSVGATAARGTEAKEGPKKPPEMSEAEKADLALGNKWIAYFKKHIAAIEKSSPATMQLSGLLRAYNELIDTPNADEIQRALQYTGSTFPQLQAMSVALKNATDRAKELGGGISSEARRRYAADLKEFAAICQRAGDAAAKGDAGGLSKEKKNCAAQYTKLKTHFPVMAKVTEPVADTEQKRIKADLDRVMGLTPKAAGEAPPAPAPDPSRAQHAVAKTKLDAVQKFLDQGKKPVERAQKPGLFKAVTQLLEVKKILDANPGASDLEAIHKAQSDSLIAVQKVVIAEIEAAYSSFDMLSYKDGSGAVDLDWLKGAIPSGAETSLRDDIKKYATIARQSIEKLLGPDPKSWNLDSILEKHPNDLKRWTDLHTVASEILVAIKSAEKGKYPVVGAGTKSPEQITNEQISQLQEAFDSDYTQLNTDLNHSKRTTRDIPSNATKAVLESLITAYTNQKSDYEARLTALQGKDAAIQALEAKGSVNNAAARKEKIQSISGVYDLVMKILGNRLQTAEKMLAAIAAKERSAPAAPGAKAASVTPPQTAGDREQLLKAALAKTLRVNVAGDESYIWFNGPAAGDFAKEGSSVVSQITAIYGKTPVAAIIVAGNKVSPDVTTLNLSLGAVGLSPKVLQDDRSGNADILIFFSAENRDAYFKSHGGDAPAEKSKVDAAAEAARKVRELDAEHAALMKDLNQSVPELEDTLDKSQLESLQKNYSDQLKQLGGRVAAFKQKDPARSSVDLDVRLQSIREKLETRLETIKTRLGRIAGDQSDFAKAKASELDALQKTLGEINGRFVAAKELKDPAQRLARYNTIIDEYNVVSTGAGKIAEAIRNEQKGLSLIPRASKLADEASLAMDAAILAKSVVEKGADYRIVALKKDKAFSGLSISATQDLITIEKVEEDYCTQNCGAIVQGIRNVFSGQGITAVFVHVKGSAAAPIALLSALREAGVQTVETVEEPDVKVNGKPHLEIQFAVTADAARALSKKATALRAEVSTRLQAAAVAKKADAEQAIAARRASMQSIARGLGGALIETTVGEHPMQAFRIPASQLAALKAKSKEIHTVMGTTEYASVKPLLVLMRVETDEEERQLKSLRGATGVMAEGLADDPLQIGYAYVLLQQAHVTRAMGQEYSKWKNAQFSALNDTISALNAFPAGGTAEPEALPTKLVRGWTRQTAIPLPSLKKGAVYRGKLSPKNMNQHLGDMADIVKAAAKSGASKILLCYNSTARSNGTPDPMSNIRSMQLKLKIQEQGFPLEVEYVNLSPLTEMGGAEIVDYIFLMPGEDEIKVASEYRTYILRERKKRGHVGH